MLSIWSYGVSNRLFCFSRGAMCNKQIWKFPCSSLVLSGCFCYPVSIWNFFVYVFSPLLHVNCIFNCIKCLFPYAECASLPSIPRGKWYCKYCQNMFEREKFVAHNANAVAAGRVSGVDPMEQITKRSIRIVDNLASEVSSCILCRYLLFWGLELCWLSLFDLTSWGALL